MKNILIIKHGSLGDIVQLSGVMRDIRNSFKNYNIVVLTSPTYKDLMSKCPYIDEVITDDRQIRWNLIYFLRLKSKLDKFNFSHVFDLQNHTRTAIYQKVFCKKSIWSSFKIALKGNLEVKEFNKLGALEKFDIQLKNSGVVTKYTMRPNLFWMIDSLFEPDILISKRYITILPFCSKHLSHKKWPFYGDLIKLLRNKYKNVQIVTVPGPDEITDAFKLDADVILNGKQATNFFQLSKILSNSLYVVANDTGPAHIAAHLGCSGLALFGSHTSSRKVSIRTDHFDVIESEDLSDITVNQVFNKIQLHLPLEDI